MSFRSRLGPGVAGLLLLAASPAAAQLPAIQSVPYVSGLSSPIGMVQDPSDPTVQFVVQQGGLIRVIHNGVLQATSFLNLSSAISTGGERGLLGLAFPTDYARSGRFYVDFTNPNGNTVIARFHRSAANPLVADAASRFDFLWPAMPDMNTDNGCAVTASAPQRFICQPYSNHNGGKLAFGSDGYLYIGMGDGGSGGDPQNQAQRPGTLLGKILRIDVSVPDADTTGYRIPADNPFLGSDVSGIREVMWLVWDVGVRNPWRFTFDPWWLGGTGAMVIGDVGQNAFEEIDYEPARSGGRNYGWSLREGTHAYSPNLVPFPAPLIEPIFDYDNSFGAGSGRSITGGYVYRGAALGAAFRGRYFYADEVSGKIASLQLTVDPVTRLATASNFVEHTAAFNSAGNITSIDIDAEGEIYVVKYSGEIRKIVPVTADTDADGMTDAQELRYGLNPALASGNDGAAGDPDGDGVTNAAEIAAGTHPRGFTTFTRQLAEGSSSSFFETSLLLLNANNVPANVVLRFLKDNATTVTWPLTIAPRRRLTVNPGQLAAIHGSSFATIVEADQEVVVERTMKWDQTNYGAHTEKAVDGPATTWFFAEGSQGFFLTYVLLTNPNNTTNTAHVRFLRESGGVFSQDFTIAPLSRRTIDCGSIPQLVNTSFGIEVTFDQPGAAERAMYFGVPPDRLFKAGHESAGATAPATEWFLAEGATGSFFETFILVSNPNSAAADLTFTYVTDTGQVVTRNHSVPANARITINIESEGSSILNNAAVATRVQATIPVIVERAQYWPNAPSQWSEAHNAFGVTTAATRWGLAEGQIGLAEQAVTFILLANNGSTAANVTVDYIRENNVPVTMTYVVPANSRLTVAPGAPGLREEKFGAVITSSQPIVVERALYWNANGEFWSAGTDATATQLLP